MRLTCTKCKIEQDETDFYPDYRRSDGKNSWCKACVKTDSARRTAYRYKNDPVFRKKVNDYQNNRNRKLREEAGVARRRRNLCVEYTVTAMKNPDIGKHSIRTEISRSPCVLLKAHAIVMKDDPERLTTGFLQHLIGRSCKFNENEAF
jgi:hypothetical protein